MRFYTGIPEYREDRAGHTFWQKKTSAMARQGIKVFTRKLRYREKTIHVGRDGDSTLTKSVPEEKGIDVRIAIDLIRDALSEKYDVALVFSQDQDLSEAVKEVKRISRETQRWIKVACAYPVSPKSTNARGINDTDWFELNRELYDACIDPRDYREKPKPVSR